MVYLDNFIVYSKTVKTISDLKSVMTILKRDKLITKTSKCKLMTSELVFLEHVVLKDVLKSDPDKTKSVLEMSAPQDRAQLRTFLGILHRYIV